MKTEIRTLVEAIEPMIAATGARLVSPEDAGPLDVPIEWDGEVVTFVRFASLANALENLVARIERELGAPLPELDRTRKQIAVRLLEERGAFMLRRSIDDIAEMMGVSRITIYNYLNAIRT